MLGDMGADVIRVDRAGAPADRLVKREHNVHGRSRRSIAVDLQNPAGQAVVRRLHGAHVPTPYSPPLEAVVAPGARDVARAVRDLLEE